MDGVPDAPWVSRSVSPLGTPVPLSHHMRLNMRIDRIISIESSGSKPITGGQYNILSDVRIRALRLNELEG